MISEILSCFVFFTNFFRASKDEDWLKNEGWDLIKSSCQFFASRVSCLDEDITDIHQCSNFTFWNVQPPDESAGVVNSSVFTNAAAGKLLEWGTKLSQKIEGVNQPFWMWISSHMYIPLDYELYSGGVVHPEYDGYEGDPINQADVILLQYPLYWPMTTEIKINDLLYYEDLTSSPDSARSFYTGDSSISIAYLRLGGDEFQKKGDDEFLQAFDHMDSSSFYIWQETLDGGHLNFLTGAGGFLQNVLFGYGGLDLEDHEGGMVVNPLLPPNTSFMKLRNIQYGSNFLSIGWDDQDSMTIENVCTSKTTISIIFQQNKEGYKIEPCQKFETTVQKFLIK